jgi:F-type H+-transporting ATPase subunit b
VFLSIDGTLLVQVVNFVLFIVLLNVVFLRPVGRAIAQRRGYIDGLARDIESGEAEVRSARGTAEEHRAAARREADAAIAKARTTAQNEAGDVTLGYQQKAQTIVEDAHRQVGGEIEAARADEARIVDGLAQTMLERALGTGAGA